MVRECDRSQRDLAAFLLLVVTLEVTLICYIIQHEHTMARAEFRQKMATVIPNNVNNEFGIQKQSILLDKVRSIPHFSFLFVGLTTTFIHCFVT